MIRRLLLVALVAAVALTPLALADHAYSHRYIVYGRVVDAAGNPAAGILVDLGTENFPGAEGPCAQQPGTDTDAFGRTESRPVTNAFGEYTFCFHAHEINRVDPPRGHVSIAEHNLTIDITFDPYTRATFVPVKLPVTLDDASDAPLRGNYTVIGRLWEPSGERVSVERIGVFGHTVDRTPVNVTLELSDGTKLHAETSTNNYGDFAVRIPTQARVTAGTVILDVRGETFTAAVDPEFGVTFFRAELTEPSDPFVRNILIGLGVIIGVAVVGGAGWWGYRRMAERRETEAARASSTRKRARR